jgi:hypothetical protein
VVLAFVIAGVLTVSSSSVSLLLQRRSRRKSSLQPHESNIEHHSTFSSDFWAHVIEEFLIQLSDQQLFLGLVVLICAFVKYYRSALGGNDNLWHAGDVACFSMASHAITLLALREFFRENKILASIRVSLMVIVFGLWTKIGYLMLRPDGPHYKAPPIVYYFQIATYIEFFGIPWVYTLTCVPLFISNEALNVGKAISSYDIHGLGESLKIWEEKYTSSNQRCHNLVTLLNLLRSIVIKFLISLNEGPKWKTRILSTIFNIFFSRVCRAVVLCLFWLLTLN